MGSLEEPIVIGSKPPGVRLIENVRTSPISIRTYQTSVLIITFVAYTTYHCARKCTSIVKSTLDPESSDLSISHWPTHHFLNYTSSNSSSGWAPFNGSDGSALLGYIDLAFLALYSFGMYFSGQLGDRLDLRWFLTGGMLGTGLFTCLFGAAYWLNIHAFGYFLVVQMLAGLFQSSGWPSVVAVVGNWFGKSKRGLIMGIWNAHTSIGNISGSLIGSAVLTYGWGWSFVVPGLMIAVAGGFVFVFLAVSPESVGIDRDGDVLIESSTKVDVEEPLLEQENVRKETKERAVGFLEAWRIPGVAPYAFCLFFSKLVAYTFLYWLPFYLTRTEIGGEYLSSSTAGSMSTVFDIGGVLGGILAGHISDKLDARAITAASFMYCAIPALSIYRIFGSISIPLNLVLMFIAGFFVNGPYALITTAVSADLGTHASLEGNSRALATVTAIIDGTGSAGAALGPLLTGYISATSWDNVFIMLMVSALFAGLLLTGLVWQEVAARLSSARARSDST